MELEEDSLKGSDSLIQLIGFQVTHNKGKFGSKTPGFRKQDGVPDMTILRAATKTFSMSFVRVWAVYRVEPSYDIFDKGQTVVLG